MKEVKVDIDYKPIDYDELVWRIGMIEEILDVRIENVELYETNKGYHVYADVEGDLDDKDLIIVQLALGSDYLRELYNLRRVKGGAKRWNVLFCAKWKYDEEKGEWVKVSKEKKDLIGTYLVNALLFFARSRAYRYLQKLKRTIKGVVSCR